MKKFIINNNKIVFGDVKQHRDLASDHTTTEGGGLYITLSDTVVMYGESIEFGRARNDRIRELILNRAYSENFKGYLFKII